MEVLAGEASAPTLLPTESKRGWAPKIVCAPPGEESRALIDNCWRGEDADKEMSAPSYLHWDPPDYEPDYDPIIEDEGEEQDRDPVVDRAKEKIRLFFDGEREAVFYKQQLEGKRPLLTV